MKRIKAFIITLTTLFTVIWISCEVYKELPDQPKLTLLNAELVDTLIPFKEGDTPEKYKRWRLTFYLEDGNGNFGLNSGDTLSPFTPLSYNMYVTAYEKKDGKITELKLATPINYRIPYKDIAGQNKTQKETIYIHEDYPVKLITYDSVFYKIYVEDRNFLKSDTVTTPYLRFKAK